jgi:uncharacterized protein YidB (DUF937 family)
MGLLEDLLHGAINMGGRAAPRAPMQPAPGGASLGASGGGMGRIMMMLLPIVLSMLAHRGQRGAGLGAPAQRGPGLGAGTGGGGLGDILGNILGGGQPGGGGGGGLGSVLGGLLNGFQNAGYGQQALSWVGTGENEPIPAHAVEQVLGPGSVAEIAQRAGLGEEETRQGLAVLLPAVVDHLTPEGTIPNEGALVDSVDALAARLEQGDDRQA